MIKLHLDLEALKKGFVYLEAENEIEWDEQLTEEFENKYGFQEIEVSPNRELLYLNHALLGGEKELNWLMEKARIFKGVYSVPELGLEKASLRKVFGEIKRKYLELKSVSDKDISTVVHTSQPPRIRNTGLDFR